MKWGGLDLRSTTSQFLADKNRADASQPHPGSLRRPANGSETRATAQESSFAACAQRPQRQVHHADLACNPIDRERLTNDLPEIVALSFFSGAMGLDIGMRNGGIHALPACEFNKYCRMTIAANDPQTALIGDINKYKPADILTLAKAPSSGKVDVIFGGPPCQAFSAAGSRRALDDERGNVFLRYIEVINDD